MPAGGFIWTPTDWSRLELIFPKPKLAQRVNVGPGFEDWIYTTAEFGGNTWPIVRTTGERDNLTYIDYRLLVGVERKLQGGAGYRLEAGYVFGRITNRHPWLAGIAMVAIGCLLVGLTMSLGG